MKKKIKNSLGAKKKMNKKQLIVFILILIIIPATFIFSADNDQKKQQGETSETGWYSCYTDGTKLLNGFYWEQLDSSGKLAYILAYEEGAFNCSLYLSQLQDAKVGSEDLKRLSGLLNSMMDTRMGATDILGYLCLFYTEPLNKHIPISVARAAIFLEQRGEKTDGFLQDMRDKWKRAVDDK